MTTASDPQVTNELLSAYIDGAVSEEERRLIETAVLQDPEVAWRLESLRATVRLLRELPELSLPRSFLLTPEQVQQPLQPAVAAALPPAPKARSADAQANADAGGFWQAVWQAVWRGWQGLWQGGSPALRNAMAASFAVLLALLLAPRFLAPPSLPPVGQVQTVAVQPAAGQLPAAKQQATATVQAYAPDEGADTLNAAAAQPAEVAPIQTSEVPGAAAEVAAEPASPDTGATAADSAAKAAPRGAPETTEAAESAASMAGATPVIAQAAEDARGAIGMAAAEAEAPAAAAAAAPAALPAAAAAPAFEQAQGVTLAQSASGSSVLDDMQRQAGGGAPESMTVASVAPPLVLEAAPAGGVAGGAAEAAPVSPLAAAATAEPTATATAVPTVAPTTMPTVAPTAAIAMAPAEVQASDQVEAVEPPAAVPAGASGSPAWLLLTLQGGALLAGVATVLFGLLWWRSRR